MTASSTRPRTVARSKRKKPSAATEPPDAVRTQPPARGPGRPSKLEERAFTIYAGLATAGLTDQHLKAAATEAIRMARAFDAAWRDS